MALNASMETDLNLVIRGELMTIREQRNGMKPLCSRRSTLAGDWNMGCREEETEGTANVGLVGRL